MVLRVLFSAVVVALATAEAYAQSARPSQARVDAFADVRCDGDVVKALVGKKSTSDRVVVTEAAHRDIGLKDLGGTVINDSLFLINWAMCGREYSILTTLSKGVSSGADLILDALLFPSHSRRQPAFIGSCVRAGNRTADAVQAVLDNPAPRKPGDPVYLPSDTTSLAVLSAWRIDEATRRFLRLETAGLRCPRGGIISADGGM